MTEKWLELMQRGLLPPDFVNVPVEARDQEAERILAALSTPNDTTPSRPPTRLRTGTGSRVRVALVTPSLMLGGAERCMVDLARWLDRERVEVLGLASKAHEYDEQLAKAIAGVTYFAWGEAACGELAARCDVLVFWGMKWQPAMAPAVVYVSHGAGPWASATRPDMSDPRWHAAAVSRWAAQVFDYPAHVKILHNGADPARLTPTIGRAAMRAKLGLAETEIAIGYVGRLTPEKNLMAAAIAAAELGPPYRAVYVGPNRGNHWDIVSYMSPRSLYVPTTDQIGDVYAALDCLISVSHSEGFCLALTEAWMAGLPTVATPVGAVPELEETYGPLTAKVPVYPTGSQLAAAVHTALSPPHRETVVRHAREVMRRDFTLAAYGRRWTDWLVELHTATTPSHV